MSYIEHGPRIFLAGRPNNNNVPLTYGDYVLPKKRLEGRLKVYDSCSDIRAWSPNPLESSQYFRELAEHATPPGKIIPFNVVIENIIGLTSQAQNELQVLRQELKKYKSLKLTTEQEKYLKTFDDVPNSSKGKEHRNTTVTKQFLKENSKVINRSTSLPHLDSYLSIQINSEQNFHYNDKYYQNLSLFSHIDSLPYRGVYLLPNLRPPYVSSKIENAGRNQYKDVESDLINLEDKHTQVVCIEYADICLQVIWDTREIGTQTDYVMEYITSSETKVSSIKASIYKYNNESRNRMKKGLSIESYTETESETSSIIESDFDIEIHERSHKEIIIQKDSEIIALKNELGVKEAEAEELKEINRNLENMLKKKDENLNNLQAGFKILQERFVKLNEQRSNELEDKEKKLYTNACIMDQLKMELNKKFEISILQSKEIEKLRSHVKETAALLLERDSLMEKVKEMERLSKEAENCRDALDQLKEALHEKDELQRQNQEQSCILADQEDEMKRLLILFQEMSRTNNDQKHRMTTLLEELQVKIIEKDNIISKYEEQLRCMEQEISDFTIKLKNNLNNIEEFKIAYEDICSRVRCKHDTCERTKRTLCTVSALMEELQKSKIEDKESLQQIGNFKNYTGESMIASHLNYYYNSSSSISEVDESNMIAVKKIQTSQKNLLKNTQLDYMNSNEMMHEYIDIESHSNKDVSEPDSWNSAKTELSILSVSNNMNVESTIVEEVSRSLIRMQSLMEELQVYAEKERPSLIKKIHGLYKDLMESKSVNARSADTTISKQEICEIYNKYQQQRERHEPCITTLIKDLQGTSNAEEFVKMILHRQLQEILLHDEQIDQIFATQIKHSIEKMNELSMALQGAGDQRVKIVKEVEKKQQELLKKDTEIARLKEQVQRGEGDCIRPEKSEWNVIKDNLKSLDSELNQKEQLIQELKDALQLNNLKLSTYITECNEIKQENESLIDAKNILLKECNTKDIELKEKHDEINILVKQLQNLDKSIQITNNVEKEIEELKIKLKFLQEENTELRRKLEDANEIICKNNEVIRDLEDKQEKDKHVLALECMKYDTLLTERQNIINKLENQNLSINEKLIDAEHQIVLLNKTISSLNEQNDGMKLLDILQIDTSKIENDIRKLEMKSSKCKLELSNYENINKENEIKLAAFTKENEIIRKDIEILKDKLSVELAQESDTTDELKHKLQSLPNELYNKIVNLKNQVCQYEKYSMHLKHNLHQDMDKDFEDEKYKSKQIDNENTKEQLSKIRNLIHEVESKDLEIENLKNRVNCLSKQNDDLYKKLKYHKENYEDKLTILKKKYDSSISALHKKHKENIEHLKMNFEEINGERIIFDSESWLQSLSIKELTNVYNRICLLMNKLDINNDNKTILNFTDKEELCGTIQNLANRCTNDQKEDALMDIQQNHIKLQEEKHTMKMQSVKLKDHNDSSKTLIQQHCLQDKNENKNKETNIFYNTTWEKTMFFDPASHSKTTKLGSNSRLYNNNNNNNNNNTKYASKNTISIPTTKTMKANTFYYKKRFTGNVQVFNATLLLLCHIDVYLMSIKYSC
ncbi:hypothetical protein KPH14_010950 [Odynerus spinipes]|uniref:Uncharacterized protein n=1 Tax=Odynerus spinipes TaxID=1348599 RepID=A0AAD9RW55_9HYME|nr:hypothetical protein KPH14_010950 [Odynerus spinipes]